MNRILRSGFFSILSAINAVLPKKKQIMIYGADCLYDNNEAMFEYLNNNTDIPVICIAKHHRSFNCRDTVRFVDDTIWNAIKYSLTSCVIIDSFFHTIRLAPHHSQKIIQLWHGTPIKRIDHHKGEKNSQYYTHIIYPSSIFEDIYKKTFECSSKKLVLCGNPRNDYLFEPQLGDLKKEGINRYAIWMPTYRHGLGQEESKKDIPVITKDNIKQLNSTLADLGIYLFVKPHPKQSTSLESIVTKMSNIGLLTDEMLRLVNIPLYSFVGSMEALLTDYSSVYFDYLLLNRPIGFVIDDYDEYKEKRGLYFDDPLSMMPGEKIYNIEQLCGFFRSLGKEDHFVEQRRKINNLVNIFQDNQNRKRISDLIQL